MISFFKNKKKNEPQDNSYSKIAALLIHAAKIDESYTKKEEEIIKKTLIEINNDLTSKSKMFRLLQGDVGSGKTIVSLISALNVVNSGYQVALMAPTEILARQHFVLAKKIFPTQINLALLSSKSENKIKKKIIDNLKTKKIDISNFKQKKIPYEKNISNNNFKFNINLIFCRWTF